MKKLLSVLLGASLLFSVAVSSHASSTVPSLPDGSAIADVEAETLQYAYMDIDEAMDQVEAQILAARNQIIFSQSFCDQPGTCGIADENGNIIEMFPSFYELYPSNLVNPDFREYAKIAKLDADLVPVSKSDVQKFAYMDIPKARQEVKEKILSARSQIIFSKSWAADGCGKICAGDDYRKLTESSPVFYDASGQCFPLSHSPVSVHPASGTQNGGRPATSTIRLGTAAIHGTNNDCENYV